VRLPPALDALVQARVRAGTPFAMLIREALSAYPADKPPTLPPTPADSADTVQNLQEQLDALVKRVVILEQAPTPRRQIRRQSADRAPTPADRRADTMPTPADTPRQLPPGAYDPAAAITRIQTLQAQGLSQRQIAATLTAEGIPTRRGGPWDQSSVAYLLKTRGR